MARMIPSTIQFKESGAEVRLFDRLRDALSDDYSVLHHVQWLERRGKRSRDKEADFVIVNRHGGALLLEVKGGAISYDAEQGKWTSTGKDGVHEIQDPFEQAKENMHSLIRKMKDVPDWPRAWGPFGYAVAFPDGSFGSVPLPHTPPEVVIQGKDIFAGDLADRVADIFEHWTDGGYRDERRGSELLVETLAHDLEIRTPLSLAVDEADREIIRWSDHQYFVLDILARQRRVAVSGPAGSGKTLMALEKARRLASEGFRTLLCCYNRPLREVLRGLPAVKETEDLEVFTFDQFCWHLAIKSELQRYAIAIPGTGSREVARQTITCPRCSAVDLYAGRTADGRLWLYRSGRSAHLCKESSNLMPVAEMLDGALTYLIAEYDAIVVDEAQDFGEDWWTPLQLLLKEADEGILYVFYDGNQAIYGRPEGLPDDLAPASLVENWRTTKQIHDALMKFYEGEDIRAMGPDGPPVEVREVRGGELRRELSRVLHRLVKEEGIPPRDLVVLTPKSAKWSGLVGPIGAFRLSENPVSGQVRLSSIYRFKGLDSKVVVVCQVNRDVPEEFRKLMYVACSRARSLLVILVDAAK